MDIISGFLNDGIDINKTFGASRKGSRSFCVKMQTRSEKAHVNWPILLEKRTKSTSSDKNLKVHKIFS